MHCQVLFCFKPAKEVITYGANKNLVGCAMHVAASKRSEGAASVREGRESAEKKRVNSIKERASELALKGRVMYVNSLGRSAWVMDLEDF